MSRKKIIDGLSLIEVLVTVLILATGLLGMAALQSRSLSYSNIAYLNTRANMLAYDMLDRIRANPAHSVAGPGYSAVLGSIPGAYPRDCESSDCLPAQLAQYDINQWQFLVGQQLPSGQASITWANTTEGRDYTIIVSFDDSRGVNPRREIQIRSIL